MVILMGVIGLRVREEVKTAWDSLTDSDKEKIKALVEELVILHKAGFKVDVVKHEMDSICQKLMRTVGSLINHPCVYRCYDDSARSLFYELYNLAQQLCKPVRPR
jgi:hypothetical protein